MKRILFFIALAATAANYVEAKPKKKHSPRPCTREILTTTHKDITGLPCVEPSTKQPHSYTDKNGQAAERNYALK